MFAAPLFLSTTAKATDEPAITIQIDINATLSLIFIKSCPFCRRICRPIPNLDEQELKIEYLWMSLAQRRRRVSLRPNLLLFELSCYFSTQRSNLGSIKGGRQSIHVRTLARRDTFAFTFNRALSKVNGFPACATGVSPTKFIRKYLFFFPALGTFAGDYLEIFKICIPGAMLGSRNIISHNILLTFKYLKLQLELMVTL
jgi:hypothetical protein